jgi:hypothetical protein
MAYSVKREECRSEIESTSRSGQELPAVVDQLVVSCGTADCFDHVSPVPLPAREDLSRSSRPPARPFSGLFRPDQH